MIAAQIVERRKTEQAASAAADAAAAVATAALSGLVAGPSDKLFYDRLMEARRGNCDETASEIGMCPICGLAMAARRQVKTLPCGHIFHFGCIDTYHRDKLNKDRCVDMPCYTCGAATNKSIASVAAEMKLKREAAVAKVKAELAANPAALAAELDAQTAGSLKAALKGVEASSAPPLPPRRPSSREPSRQEAPEPIGDFGARRLSRDGSRSRPLSNAPESAGDETLRPAAAAAKRASSRRRNGGALAALARASNTDGGQT